MVESETMDLGPAGALPDQPDLGERPVSDAAPGGPPVKRSIIDGSSTDKAGERLIAAEATAEQPGMWPISDRAAEEEQLLSRRRFLSGAMAGGAAGLAAAAVTGVGVWKVADAQAQAAAAAAQAEMNRLKGLVERYEALEKVGLDGILETGMAAVALPLGAVEAGAKVLRKGLDLFEGALRSAEEALPTARESILWLEERVAALAGAVSRLEAGLAQALDKLADNAVVERLRELVGTVLDKLPFGLGDKVRAAFDGLVDLATGADELLLGVNDRLLDPMRDRWFSEEEGKGLAGSLIDPLVEHVLDPLEAHLADLAGLADAWQQKMLAPAQRALEERAQGRLEIERYRQEHGL